MQETNYGITKAVESDFDTTISKVTEALKSEGFGVLTTIDVKAKMKEALGKDMENYIILGACNPSSAYKVLQEETEIGLLLPCNVIVYNENGKTHVAVIRPTKAMNMIENSVLEETANEIEEKLKTVLKSI